MAKKKQQDSSVTSVAVEESKHEEPTVVAPVVIRMAAGGQEVKELVLQWHQSGRKIEKKALVAELCERFPGAVSVKTDQPIGPEQWLGGLNNVLQELRSSGQIPYERIIGQRKEGQVTAKKTEPTLSDLRVVNDYLAQKQI